MSNTTRFGFESITYAMQARDLLSRHGIKSDVVRLRAGESPAGCAFGLELFGRDASAAGTLLSKAQLKFRHLGV